MSAEPSYTSTPPPEPLAYRAVRGGLWVALSSYWTTGLGFIANIILVRLLSETDFGQVALAMFFVQLLRLQPKLGLGVAFAHYKETDGTSLGTYVALDTALTLGGFAAVWLVMPVLLQLGYAGSMVQVCGVLAFASMLEGLANMGTLFLEKELHFSPTSLAQSIAFPLSYAPAFWLALNGGGAWSLVAQNITFNLLMVAIVWWSVRRRLPQLWALPWRFDASLARQFMKFGITTGLGQFAASLLTQLDNFLIGTFVGIGTLGFYDRAYRTAEWPGKLLNSLLNRTAFYTYARLQDDQARLQKTFTMVTWLITSLAMPLGLAVFVAAPDLVRWLYGDRWAPSVIFLRILIIYSVTRPLWENAGALFIAVGKPRLTAQFIVLQVFALVLLGLPMTLLWGAIGTSLAVGIAFSIGLFLSYRDIQRILPIQLMGVLGLPLIIAVLVVAGYTLINRFMAINTLPIYTRVALKMTFASLAYMALIGLIQPRATQERLTYIWRLIRGNNSKH